MNKPYIQLKKRKKEKTIINPNKTIKKNRNKAVFKK